MTKIDPTRNEIFVRLQREADSIAASASEALMAAWSDTLKGVPTARIVDWADEALLMMQDGFQKLGGVVRFAILVDEPGLITEDMKWLKQMFGERQIVPGPANWDAILLDTYSRACFPFLDESQQSLLQDLTNRAAALLANSETH